MTSYENDWIMRQIELMGGLIRKALERLRLGAGDEEPLELTEEAIGLSVDMDPRLFVRLSPQSMASFLEISNTDPRIVERLAEALEAQAEILESEGELLEAGVRREQAEGVRRAFDHDLLN